MLAPLLLIALATGAATIIAYGMHPGLAETTRGLAIIMFTRRAEWPLILLSLVPCLGLLWMVISGKRRLWWLIGLMPVLALFTIRFAPWRQSRYYVLASPVFVDAGQPGNPDDHEWVVGVVFNGQAYALPYRQLFRAPVVFITDYDKRMMLMWSPFANRAYATTITRELKARDLEVTAPVADSFLIYDRRLGQFICALTGQTIDRRVPVGFAQPLPTLRTTWAEWRRLHPAGKSLLTVFAQSDNPAAPMLPRGPSRVVEGSQSDMLISVVHMNPPVAVAATESSEPIRNCSAGAQCVLLVVDPKAGRTRAFDRHVGEDLFPTFARAQSHGRSDGAFMTDRDSGSIWTIDGKCIQGPLKDAQLTELPIEDGLYWGPMKYWYPALVLAK